MNIKMFSSISILSVVAILTVDIRIGAFRLKDVEPRRCYQCEGAACDQPNGAELRAAACPTEQPYCATFASAPNFKQGLMCAAASVKPCTLKISEKRVYEITCVCPTQLCNAPFTQELRKQLIFYSTSNSSNTNGTDLAETFWRVYYANVSEAQLYRNVTVEIGAMQLSTCGTSQVTAPGSFASNVTVKTPAQHRSENMLGARAEALKQEATVPSDDDEDESEGSGIDDEMRTRSPASAPAAPSSYLPAHENNAQQLFFSFLASAPMLYHIIG